MSGVTPDDARQLSDMLKLFGQAQRLQILDALMDGAMSVGQIEKLTGIGQPTLSQQLATLRRAGVLDTQRESRTVFYDIANEDERLRVRLVLSLLKIDTLRATLSMTQRPLPGVQASQGGGGAQFAKIMRPTAVKVDLP